MSDPAIAYPKILFFQFIIVSLMFNLTSSLSPLFLPLSLITRIFQNTNNDSMALLFSLNHTVSCHAPVNLPFCCLGYLPSIQAFKLVLRDLNFLNKLTMASSLNVCALPELLLPSVLPLSLGLPYALRHLFN